MKILSIIFLALVLSAICFGQTTTPPESQPDKRYIPIEADKVEERISSIINRSIAYYREGELDVQKNDLVKAREKFDKSVEVILLSGINVRSSARLQTYYAVLTENIYQLENPNSSKSLRLKSFPSENETSADLENSKETEKPRIGFTEQVAVTSADDPLAKPLSEAGAKLKKKDFAPKGDSPMTKVCTKKFADLPDIRGLKLGAKMKLSGSDSPNYNTMVIKWSTTGLPTFKNVVVEKTADLGFRKKFFFEREGTMGGLDVDGISGFEISTLDDKIIKIVIGYNPSESDPPAQVIADTFKKEKGIPFVKESFISNQYQSFSADCRDFEAFLKVSIGDKGSDVFMTLKDKNFEKELLRRDTERKAKAIKPFKP